MQLKEHIIRGIQVFDVLDSENRLFLRVASDFGAKIMELNMTLEENIIPVLWKADFEELDSNEFGKNDILFPFPNRLDCGAYEYNGTQYKFPINEKELNNSIHGFLRERRFEFKHEKVEENSAEVTFSFTFDGESFYPFPFVFEVTYHIMSDFFQVSFSITNSGNQTMPFGLGWHPYFVLDRKGSGKINLPDRREHLVNDRYLPTGEIRIENGKFFEPDSSFYNATFEIMGKSPFYELELRKHILDIEASDSFGFLQLYTPPKMNAVAIEPMTCCINSFNNKIGFKELSSLEIFNVDIKIKLSNKLIG